ncbi:MAG: DUF4834 family protein [Bacteroides sp.]|nr:DUF4834 family protein [Bacteroides sp.]
MFGFFGFILIFILIVFLIGFALLGNLVRFVFGLGRQTPKRYSNRTGNDNRTNNTYSSTTSTDNGNKKKIFGDDEGEYVEFEEVQ